MRHQEPRELHRLHDERTGRVIGEGRMEAGNREGCWILWYRSGECRALGVYVEDSEHGLWTYWYKNGRKAAEGVYVDGLEEGPWTYWYEDGVVKSQGVYQRGAPHGRWTHRDLRGHVERYEQWHEGTLERCLRSVA